MTNNSIYSSFIEAKTGELIPALKNGKTLESRYNPKNDALKKLNTIDSSKSFFIVIGIDYRPYSSDSCRSQRHEDTSCAKTVTCHGCCQSYARRNEKRRSAVQTGRQQQYRGQQIYPSICCGQSYRYLGLRCRYDSADAGRYAASGTGTG